MKRALKKIAAGVKTASLLVLAFAPVVLSGGWAWAAPGGSSPSGGAAPSNVETSILPGDWGIEEILKFILQVIVYGLGVAAVLGTIIAGVLYLTARDNESQVTKAKTRLYEVVIGLIAWALMYAVLNWLIPGALNF